MGAPITWQTVRGNNNDDLIKTISGAYQNMGKSIQGIGEAINTGTGQYVDNQTKEFLHDLNQAPNDEARRQMIAAAKTAFLDSEKIHQTNQQLNDRDKANQLHQFTLDDRAKQENANKMIMQALNNPNISIRDFNNLENQLIASGASVNPMQLEALRNKQTDLLDQTSTSNLFSEGNTIKIKEEFDRLRGLSESGKLTSGELSAFKNKLAKNLVTTQGINKRQAEALANTYFTNTLNGSIMDTQAAHRDKMTGATQEGQADATKKRATDTTTLANDYTSDSSGVIKDLMIAKFGQSDSNKVWNFIAGNAPTKAELNKGAHTLSQAVDKILGVKVNTADKVRLVEAILSKSVYDSAWHPLQTDHMKLKLNGDYHTLESSLNNTEALNAFVDIASDLNLATSYGKKPTNKNKNNNK